MERSINKLFDSEVDGDDVEYFKFFVKDHNQLYFIVIDDHNNVFGHYHPGYITHVEGTFIIVMTTMTMVYLCFH